MPQAERYEPTGELHVFDSGEDDVAPEEEGSRLALLLVLALFVLGAFAGVVYLAYSQGVKQGRDEGPHAVAQSTQLPRKVETAPKSAANAPIDEDAANENSAPPPPTAMTPAEKPKPHALAPAQITPPPKSTVATGLSQAKPSAPPPPPVAEKQPELKSTVTSAPVAPKPLPHKAATALPLATQPDVATHAPKPITPTLSPPAPTKLAQTTPPPVSQPKIATAPPSTTPPATTATAPVAEPTKLPTIASAAKASGGFVLQIGAYKSQAEAMASWRAYKSAHAAVATYEPDIRQVELPGKGTWYRLRVGSFADTTEASALCAKLKADGANCFPAKR
jgi:cell division protein FtsN